MRAHRHLLLRCFTRGAGTPPSLLSSLRVPGNLPSHYNLGDLLVEFQEDGVGMVMRAYAALSPMVTFRTGLDNDERQFCSFA